MTSHIHPGLALFLQSIDGLGLEVARSALKAHVDRGGGDWLCPPPDGSEARPATHMWEIQAFGVPAWGADELDAVNNWLIIARREIAWRAA